MPRRMTTTAYAVLGLLAMRPWSAYELAKAFDRTFRYSWPTSSTHLYEEPKRLVAAGLATSGTEPAGPTRTRTVYAITDAGRAELDGWLGSPVAPPEVNHEALVRLAFADQGTVEQLDATLAAQQEDVERLYADGIDQVRGYLEDGGPFPERLHLIALGAEFHARLLELQMDWLASARAEVATWRTTAAVGLTATARARLEGVLAAAEARGIGIPPAG